MDVRGAKAPQAVPSPGRTPLSRPRPAAPGLARAGGRASCLPPDIGIATRAPRASAPPTAPPRPTDTQRRGRQPPRHRRAAPALARPGLHSPGPARPRPGWRTRVLPAPDIGILTRTLPQAAPSPGRTPPVRPQDNPGTRTPGLRPASPGLARPRPGSPALARPRPASPGLVDARPACPRHWHRDPRTPSRWTSAGLHAARLAPMYPGMADARTPPLKICTTSLTWSPILYVPAPHAPPETQALLPSRSTGADGRPVLGPDLGQVALPPGPPGQTGARSWAPTWARSPCPPVHRGRRAPGPGPRPGPGRLAPRSTGADRRPVLGPNLGQVALPPGTPGQTGARSWAPTWARSPCPQVHRGRPAPGPGPRPGPGRLAPRYTRADGRPVLGPDLGQVALPAGPPGQTGARSWAPTWARSPCPPVLQGRPAPGPGPRPGPGRLPPAPPGQTGAQS